MFELKYGSFPAIKKAVTESGRCGAELTPYWLLVSFLCVLK